MTKGIADICKAYGSS